MSTADPPLRPKRVLLVEDERDVRDALAEVLESERYEVLRAAHGAEALRMLTGTDGIDCDLIVLDLMMPVMNGWDFRKKQRADAQLARIPVLLMSAGAHLATACGDLDAADFVSKPVDIPDLLAKLERHAGAHAVARG